VKNQKVYVNGIPLETPPDFIDPYDVLEGLESFAIHPLSYRVNRENYGDPFSWFDSGGTTDWKPGILEAREKGWRIWIVSSMENTWDHGLVFEETDEDKGAVREHYLRPEELGLPVGLVDGVPEGMVLPLYPAPWT